MFFLTETWKKLHIWAIVISWCMLVLGLIMVIWPGISALAICCIMGIICVAVGITELMRYFRLGFAGVFFRFDLSLGILSILIGLLLFIHPSGAMVFLPIAIGIYLIMESVFCIQLSVEMHRFQNENWWIALLWGIVGALLACLLLIDPFTGASALMIFVGVCLMVGGVQSLYLVRCATKEVKRMDEKAAKNGKIIDTDWTAVDDTDR